MFGTSSLYALLPACIEMCTALLLEPQQSQSLGFAANWQKRLKPKLFMRDDRYVLSPVWEL